MAKAKPSAPPAPAVKALLLDHAKRVADVLGAMFGSGIEIAVHDLADLDHSLVHLVGDLTHRAIGSPITDLVLQVLTAADRPEAVADMVNYRTTNKHGQEMKSSTVFLRDESGHVVGALCINFDVGSLRPAARVLGDLLSFESDDKEGDAERFPATVGEMVDQMVGTVLERLPTPLAAMSVEEKLQCLYELDRRGLFLIKGAVDYVAKRFDVTKYTIYSYLQKIRADRTFPHT